MASWRIRNNVDQRSQTSLIKITSTADNTTTDTAVDLTRSVVSLEL